MPPPELPHLAWACAAGFAAGAINSVAGGGTMVSFPTLIWLGLPAVIANATNTVAIWPGSLGSLWGFRRELARTHSEMRRLLIPGVVGGAIGAVLLRITPPGVFDRIVPFLILFATLLFIVQIPIQRYFRTTHAAVRRSGAWLIGAALLQLAVGIYGGYFGAGISIMNLSILGVLGMTDILEMNALTSLFSLSINGVAAVVFISAGLVYWPYVLAMAIGAVIGGYGAAGVARRIPRMAVRAFVILVGFTIAIVMFARIAR